MDKMAKVDKILDIEMKTDQGNMIELRGKGGGLKKIR